MQRWKEIVGCLAMAAGTLVLRRCASYRNSSCDLHGQDIAAARSAEANEPAAQLTQGKEKVPVHPWHEEWVENIRPETDMEVIENLANFDDGHFAETVSGLPSQATKYWFRVRQHIC